VVTSTMLTWLVPASPELAVVVRQKATSRPSGDHDRSEAPRAVARLHGPEVRCAVARRRPPRRATGARGTSACVVRVPVVARLESVVEAGGAGPHGSRVFGDEPRVAPSGRQANRLTPSGALVTRWDSPPPTLITWTCGAEEASAGQESESVAGRREAWAREGSAVEGEAAVGPCGEVNGHELGVVAVLGLVARLTTSTIDLPSGAICGSERWTRRERSASSNRFVGASAARALLQTRPTYHRPQGSRHEV